MLFGPRVVRTMSDTAYKKMLIRDDWMVETYSSGLNVGCLSLAALLSLGILIQNVHWRS